MTNTKFSFLFVLTIALTQFVMPFMFAGVGIILPKMGLELGATAVELGLVETVYIGVAGALVIPMGRWADITDKNLIFTLGLLFYALTTLVLGYIHSIELFIIFRAFQSLAATMVIATNMAILTEWVPKEQLGRAIGLTVGGVYAGLAAGPFLAGIITNQIGWRWVFYLTAIPLFFAFLLSAVSIKGRWVKPTAPFDWIGSITICIAMALLILGSSLLGHGSIGYILCAMGFIGFFFFYSIEKKIPSPLVNFGHFGKNPVLIAALFIQVFAYAGSFGVTFLFSIYLQTSQGFSPQQAGQTLIIAPVIMATFAPIFGRLSDSFSPYKIAAIGITSCFIGILIATQVNSSSEMTWVYAVLFFQGIGFAMFSSPNMTIIMNAVEKQYYSIASSLTAATRTIGMVFSMVIITILMALLMKGQPVSTETAQIFTHIMTIAFSIFAGISFCGVLLSLIRKPSTEDHNGV